MKEDVTQQIQDMLAEKGYTFPCRRAEQEILLHDYKISIWVLDTNLPEIIFMESSIPLGEKASSIFSIYLDELENKYGNNVS